MTTSTTLKSKEPRTILGVPGRAENVIIWPGNGNTKAPRELANQGWVSQTRRWEDGPDRIAMRVRIRHDDNCRNGHPSFAVTVDGFTNGQHDWGGADHDAVREHFPELAPLLRWHLCSTDGPMHYVANTTYHASDRDHNGLRKGEARQIINGRTKEPVWHLVMLDEAGEEVRRPGMVDAASKPELTHRLEWRPVLRIGEGKSRDFAAARRSAVWPDAPDEVLSMSREELAKVLTARLPGLLLDFRKDVESVCGMFWNAESATVAS